MKKFLLLFALSFILGSVSAQAANLHLVSRTVKLVSHPMRHPKKDVKKPATRVVKFAAKQVF